jgi:hypothetical protein
VNHLIRTGAINEKVRSDGKKVVGIGDIELFGLIKCVDFDREMSGDGV